LETVYGMVSNSVKPDGSRMHKAMPSEASSRNACWTCRD